MIAKNTCIYGTLDVTTSFNKIIKDKCFAIPSQPTEQDFLTHETNFSKIGIKILQSFNSKNKK